MESAPLIRHIPSTASALLASFRGATVSRHVFNVAANKIFEAIMDVDIMTSQTNYVILACLNTANSDLINIYHYTHCS